MQSKVMTKSTWMILVVTFAVFCLVRANGTTTPNPIKFTPANKETTTVHSTVIVSSNGSHIEASSSGGVQPTTEKPPIIPSISGASSSGLGAHISVTTDANKPPGETRKVNITTPGEKNGVNMLSANVLMLLALVSVCLEMYFR